PAGSLDVFTAPGAVFAAQNSDIASQPGFTFTDRGGNLIGVAPSLGPLANNGGPTQTVAELAGSPTINPGATPSTPAPIPPPGPAGLPAGARAGLRRLRGPAPAPAPDPGARPSPAAGQA